MIKEINFFDDLVFDSIKFTQFKKYDQIVKKLFQISLTEMKGIWSEYVDNFENKFDIHNFYKIYCIEFKFSLFQEN